MQTPQACHRAVSAQLQRLVRSIEDRVDDLVAQAKVDRQLTQTKPLDADSMWTVKQNSLSGLKSDWMKVKNLAKCLERQLEHQTNYHMFYQTLKEYQIALEAAFAGFRDELAGQRFAGSKEEAKWLFDQMQNLITSVLQWWQRIDSLIIQSRKVLPMSARLGPLEMKRPGKVLVDFEAQGLALKANDDVFVVDTSDRDVWTVETTRGQEVSLPSMCIAVCGPDPEVMERALSVRTLLLVDWTTTLKEVGRSLVSFILRVFRQMNTAEVDSFSETSLEGHDLQPLLEIMEKLLQAYWTKHPDFEDMAERISKARVSLAIYDDPQDIDDYTHIDINTLFLQLSPVAMSGSESDQSSPERDTRVTQKMLTLLMRKYQELIKYWEVYKVLVETSNDPNYFWMMEEFQKLRYINVTELLNFLASEDKETWLHYIHQMMGRSGRKLTDPVVTPTVLEQDLGLQPDSLRLMESPAVQGRSRVLIDVTDGRAFVQSERAPQVGGRVSAEIINANLNGHSNGNPVADSSTFVSTASLLVNENKEGVEIVQPPELQPPPPEPQPPPQPQPQPKQHPQPPPQPKAQPQPQPQPQPQRPTELPVAPPDSDAGAAGVKDRVAALERSLSIQESPSSPPTRSPSAAGAKPVQSPSKAAQIEEFKQEEVEHSSRIVISGVIDTLSNATLSMQAAIDRGIIHSESGSYLNRDKNVWIPIPVAVSEGLIIVERRTEEQHEVKRQQVYGIVTIKGGVGGGGGAGPTYAVTAVHDRLRRSKLSPEEAQRAGLADESLSKFYDTERSEWLPTSDAAERGIIEYDVKPAPGGVSEDVSFVVYTVVDVANKLSVSFKEARDKGLIDTDEGVFVNSRTKERLEFDEAIRKGFLKADRVTGPVTQVAGAEQRVVVNRLKSARSRVHSALAFQAKAAGKGGNA